MGQKFFEKFEFKCDLKTCWRVFETYTQHNGVNTFWTLKTQILRLQKDVATLYLILTNSSLMTQNYFLKSNPTSNAEWTHYVDCSTNVR